MKLTLEQAINTLNAYYTAQYYYGYEVADECYGDVYNECTQVINENDAWERIYC